MSLFGAALVGGGLSLAGSLFGDDDVDIPTFEPIDVDAEVEANIRSSLRNFDEASELTSRLNAESADELNRQLRSVVPGLDRMTQEQSDLILSQLRGEIPDSVSDQITASAAERAAAGGFTGSGAAANLTARDLGLTALQIQQQGFGNAINFLQSARQNRVAPIQSSANQFLTPQQRINTRIQERNRAFNTELQRNASGGGFESAISNTLGTVGGAVLGGSIEEGASRGFKGFFD